ncbi:hypothetical protein G6M26_23295 [Agrobacterium tumefaciens]|nr:hypothetical protein [Agrobacterium tumefaciens]NTE21469.1 hypothetical protein [Agrobacterium tumefaciens]
MYSYEDDYTRPISRHTHVQLHDLIQKVNKSFGRLGSPWILCPRPNSLTTSIQTKNVETGQEIYLIEDCSVDDAYKYVQGYHDALINLHIDGVKVVFESPKVVLDNIKRKKILGVF